MVFTELLHPQPRRHTGHRIPTPAELLPMHATMLSSQRDAGLKVCHEKCFAGQRTAQIYSAYLGGPMTAQAGEEDQAGRTARLSMDIAADHDLSRCNV